MTVDLMCNNCRKQFGELAGFLQHTIECIQPASAIYVCSVCQLLTNKMPLVEKHCKQAHKGKGSMQRHMNFNGEASASSASGGGGVHDAPSGSRKRCRQSLPEKIGINVEEEEDESTTVAATGDGVQKPLKRRLVARRRQAESAAPAPEPQKQQQQQQASGSSSNEVQRRTRTASSSGGSESSTPVSVASAAVEGKQEPPPPPPKPLPHQPPPRPAGAVRRARNNSSTDDDEEENDEAAQDPFDAASLIGFAPITDHLRVRAIRCGDRVFPGDGGGPGQASPTVRLYQEGLQLLVAGHNLFFTYRIFSNIIFGEFGYNCLVGCLSKSHFASLCRRFDVNPETCQHDWRLRICLRLANALSVDQLSQLRRCVAKERRNMSDGFALRRLLVLTEEWSQRLAVTIGMAE